MVETVEIYEEITEEDLKHPSIVIYGTTLQEEVSPLLTNYGSEDGTHEMYINTSSGLRKIGRCSLGFDEMFSLTMVGYELVERVDGKSTKITDEELVKRIRI